MTLKKEPKRKKEENVDRLKVEDLMKVVRGTKVESRQREQKIKSPITKPSEVNKVKEAYTRDVGRGVARIDYDTMDLLGLSVGDTVEIKGKRITAARVLPIYPSEEGQGIIRIDLILRENAKVQLEDRAVLRKIKPIDAVEVFVENSEWIPPIDERYIADSLDKVPVTKGDIIAIPYFGGTLNFRVVDIAGGEEVAIVREKTVFHIKENKALVTVQILSEADKKIQQIESDLSDLKGILKELRGRVGN